MRKKTFEFPSCYESTWFIKGLHSRWCFSTIFNVYEGPTSSIAWYCLITIFVLPFLSQRNNAAEKAALFSFLHLVTTNGERELFILHKKRDKSLQESFKFIEGEK